MNFIVKCRIFDEIIAFLCFFLKWGRCTVFRLEQASWKKLFYDVFGLTKPNKEKNCSTVGFGNLRFGNYKGSKFTKKGPKLIQIVITSQNSL